MNDHLLARQPLDRVLAAANFSSVLLTVALLIVAVTQVGGVATVAALLFGFCSSRAFIRPNSIGAALEHQPDRAGTAAALMGSLQFALGTAGGALLGLVHDGTARSFAFVLCLLSLLGLMSHRSLARGTQAAAM